MPLLAAACSELETTAKAGLVRGTATAELRSPGVKASFGRPSTEIHVYKRFYNVSNLTNAQVNDGYKRPAGEGLVPTAVLIPGI